MKVIDTRTKDTFDAQYEIVSLSGNTYTAEFNFTIICLCDGFYLNSGIENMNRKLDCRYDSYITVLDKNKKEVQLMKTAIETVKVTKIRKISLTVNKIKQSWWNSYWDFPNETAVYGEWERYREQDKKEKE